MKSIFYLNLYQEIWIQSILGLTVGVSVKIRDRSRISPGEACRLSAVGVPPRSGISGEGGGGRERAARVGGRWRI